MSTAGLDISLWEGLQSTTVTQAHCGFTVVGPRRLSHNL